MQYIILFLLVLIIAYLIILLRNKEVQCREAQTQTSQIQEQMEQMEQMVQMYNDIVAIHDKVWDEANTIHLYAALSDEESSTVSVKDKQSEIIRLSEKIMEQIHK